MPTFPLAEVKFGSIERGLFTRIHARVYRVDDGGLDADGNQLYARTLWADKTFIIPYDATPADIITAARARLDAALAALGISLPENRIIVNL